MKKDRDAIFDETASPVEEHLLVKESNRLMNLLMGAIIIIGEVALLFAFDIIPF